MLPAPPPTSGEKIKLQFGDVAARGLAWIGFGTIAGKMVSLVAQIALGWLLSEGDFALYSLAISMTFIVAALRDGGTQRILMQQGARFATLAQPVFRIALIFNLVGAGCLLISAPLAAVFYREPVLAWLIAIVALSVPLSTPAMVMRAHLSVELRFDRLARIDTAAMFIRQGATVLLAALGMGPYSFVFPAVLVAIFEWVALRWAIGPLPPGEPLTLQLAKRVLVSSVWIMTAAPAISLLMHGDYLVIGRVRPDILGSYFFGFQLVASAAAVFAGGLQGVLMPIFSRLGDDRLRLAAAYMKAVRLLTFVTAPLCVGMAVMAQPIVHVLWNGKWNEATPVVEIMSLSLIALLLTPLAMGMIEARGRWALRAGLLFFHAAGVLSAAYVGCRVGGIAMVAVWVASQHILHGLIQAQVAARLIGAHWPRLVASMAPAVLTSVAAGSVCVVIFDHVLVLESQWLKAGAVGMLFTALIGLFWAVFMKAQVSEVWTLLRRWRSVPNGR